MIDQRSKIARPSSIPSLKPGLLAGQPKLRGQGNQESKLKPMKATHITSKENTTENPVKPNISANKSGIRNLSTSMRSTPARSRSSSNIRSSIGDSQQKPASVARNRITPRRSEVKNSPVKDQTTPSKRQQSARRSLLPRQLKSTKDDSPVSTGELVSCYVEYAMWCTLKTLTVLCSLEPIFRNAQ